MARDDPEVVPGWSRIVRVVVGVVRGIGMGTACSR